MMIIEYKRRRRMVIAGLVLASMVTAANAQDYATEVLNLNPVGYWRLGEAGGATADDLSTNDLDGTYNGSVTLGRPGALVGDSDTAAAFSGGYVEVSHDSSLLLNNGTVTLWFNDTDTVSGGILSKDASYFVTGGHLTIRTDDTDRLTVRLQSTTDSYEVTGADPIQSDRWYMLAVTFGAGGLNLYLDGVLEDTNAYTGGLIGNTEPMVFAANTWASSPGGSTPLTEYYSGVLDEVAIFDTALSAGQIEQLHTTGLVPEPASLALLAGGALALVRRRRG